MSYRKRREPLASVDALLGSASGLAEALLVLCNTDAPRVERRSALEESRWYMTWFNASGVHVELKDAKGEGVALSRGCLPMKAIVSITMRSLHTVTLPMLTSLHTKGDEKGVQALLARRAALGSAVLIVPVAEPTAGDERLAQTQVELC